MNMKPAPGCLHILTVKLAANVVNGVHLVTETAASMGRVVSNDSEKLGHIKPGHIVYFNPGNVNLVGIDAAGENCILHEDAVMSSCLPEEVEGKIVGDRIFVKAPERPIIRANGDQGVIVRKPR